MKKLFTILTFLILSQSLFSQTKAAFWEDIENFKKADREIRAPEDAILLVGSSSFTMWKDVADYFPGKTFINRGFGGSSLFDLNFYSKELLQPYKPSQIIIYCGENDFAANENLKPREVFNRFKHFYAEVRRYHPNVPVSYISIKLSPSRKHLWPKFTATNKMIRKFMELKPNAAYIDIVKPMTSSNGEARKELFLDDQLHLTPEGYKIWATQMTPHIK